jgi:hypothetical protein
MDDFWEMMWATPTYAVQYIDPDNLSLGITPFFPNLLSAGLDEAPALCGIDAAEGRRDSLQA